MSTAINPTRIVVIGGSFGGMAAVSDLAKQAKKLKLEIILVEPRDHQFYVPAFPRAVALPGFAEKCFIPFGNAPAFKSQGARHERARAQSVYTDRVVLDDGRELPYDYLVIATGSNATFPSKVATDSVEEGINQYKQLLETVKASNKIVIVGGGAAGVEIAGEISQHQPNKQITLVSADDKLIAYPKELSDKLRDKVLKKLKNHGINVLLGRRVELSEEARRNGFVAGQQTWRLDNGETIEADLLVSHHTALESPVYVRLTLLF
jgi:NADH dehydrogenase FAD-containing subunit